MAFAFVAYPFFRRRPPSVEASVDAVDDEQWQELYSESGLLTEKAYHRLQAATKASWSS